MRIRGVGICIGLRLVLCRSAKSQVRSLGARATSRLEKGAVRVIDTVAMVIIWCPYSI
jgi:hypothetical protein